ncbi:MAG TPA: gamma-glutamylcyclotransferase family protein [Solirubrobacteraceae bacterium]|nr:gamma-glutamylcyclotransferase family protein [Solirubrobacteraceae bacterium]
MAGLLAVYGTLMTGLTYDGRPRLEDALRSLGACRIPGVLHVVGDGDYPCLMEGPGTVAGELYEVLDEAILPELDAYEDAEYERRLVRLAQPDVEAWTYLWVAEAPGERIDDGDWRSFLALRGDR